MMRGDASLACSRVRAISPQISVTPRGIRVLADGAPRAMHDRDPFGSRRRSMKKLRKIVVGSALMLVAATWIFGESWVDEGRIAVAQTYQREPPSQRPGTTTTVRPGEEGAPLSVAESAHVVRTIDTGEIDLATLARDRASDPRVREFAERMITEHTRNRSEVDAWASRAGVTPQSNPVSTRAELEANRVRTQLEAQSGRAFDRAYVDSQVTMHANALSIIDSRLLPGATDPAFRSLLTNTRSAVRSHLTMAEQMRAELGD
jgi:putative membrane protein